MSISLLGGFAKGRKLDVPSEKITRPTSVLLKRKFFDRYQNLSGYHFYDLCAGSGSVGLEAISRGALSATFIEQNDKAFRVLKKNCHSFSQKFSNLDIQLKKLSLEQFLPQLILSEEMILFFDPPYENLNLYKTFFDAVNSSTTKPAIVAVEACKQKTMSVEGFLDLYPGAIKVQEQGTSYFALYEF